MPGRGSSDIQVIQQANTKSILPTSLLGRKIGTIAEGGLRSFFKHRGWINPKH